MDNTELFSRMREANSRTHSRLLDLDSKLFEMRMKAADRIIRIWLVMLSGFYVIALFGLCLIHQAYEESVHEMRRELVAMHLSPPPEAGNAGERQ